MFREVVERDLLLAYLRKLQTRVEEHLAQGGGAIAVGEAKATRDDLASFSVAAGTVLDQESSDEGQAAAAGLAEASAFPFVPRSALLSLLQGRLEKCGKSLLQDVPAKDALLGPREQSLPAVTDERFPVVSSFQSGLEDVRGDFEPYGPCDWRWVVCEIAKLTKAGNYPFNAKPAEANLAEKARFVLFSDWASGIPRARAVTATGMPNALQTLDAGFELHAAHLGDTYYAGEPDEQLEHVIGCWPTLSPNLRSWALPGNHDYYSGGKGYFETVLGNEIFREQRSPDGKPSSLFQLSNKHWRVIGLDTGWQDQHLTPDGWEFLELALKEAKDAAQRVILLSHHQQHSAYATDVPADFTQRTNALLGESPVVAWFWGHEHRCTVYKPTPTIQLAACVGNGGLPEWVDRKQLPDEVLFDCEEIYDDHDDPDSHYRRFGFAVVDLEPQRMTARFFLEDGSLWKQLPAFDFTP